MKRILSVLIFLIPLSGLSQRNLKDLPKVSGQTLIYKISAAAAIKYLKWDSIPTDNLINAAIHSQFPTGLVIKENLEAGHYILLNVVENKIVAELYNRSDLKVFTVNNGLRLQLDIRKNNVVVEDAFVFVNEKAAKYNSSTQTYWINRLLKQDARVVINAPGDTLLFNIEKSGRNISKSEKRRMVYKASRLYKIINWLPDQFDLLFNIGNRSNKNKTAGYMVLNQPKYKPLDTVKFKAYMVNERSHKQYNKATDLIISYSAKKCF